MSLNATSNITVPYNPACHSNSSVLAFLVFACIADSLSSAIFTAYAITNILFVLPMCGVILWKVFRQWRCSGTAPSSQSDVLVFYMATTEIMGIVGTVFCWSSIYTCSLMVREVGFYIFMAIYPAQTFFHCLACVERYMAVVHPITYLSLRTSGGLRIRHISCWAIWLFCSGLIGLTRLTFPHFPDVLYMVMLAFIIVVVSFCSLAVLHNLLQPKVGSEGTDQFKLRAFYSIVLITGALVLRSGGLMIYNVVLTIDSPKPSSICLALMFGTWLCFPSIIVVPLLYLHKQGGLASFSCNSKPREK